MVARWSIFLACMLLLAPGVSAGLDHGHASSDETGRLIQDWLVTRQVSGPLGAEQAVSEGGYPLPPSPVVRFANYTVREDLTSAGDLAGAKRVLRFAHVTDMQLVDDDAPYPIRQAPADEAFAATISGGAERPQEEYGDEILHSMVDILNAHHAIDPFDFAIHTGDNIDNALENELMRYIDLVDGTHTTTGPVSGFQCAPDGQSENVDDDSNNVEDQCTSVPEHLVEHLRGLAPDMPWYSLNGNHDTLIQGNVNVEPGFQETAAEYGRHFLYLNEYVGMHFQDLDPCGGGSEADDFGHGYGFAGERLCDGDQDNDAYYAFDQRGIRLIALDTVNDEVYETNQNLGGVPISEGTGEQDLVSGVSEGAIDAEQFAWLQSELDGASDRLTFVFGHHTIKAFYNRQFEPLCGPPGCFNDVLYQAGFIGQEDMQELMTSHPQVVSWIGGHTHEHRVTPQVLEGAESPGYWNIETSGLLDLPQETRIIEVWATADGSKGFFALDPIGHTFELAKELAATDPDHDAAAAEGTELDQRVLLWFDIPQGISVETGPQPTTGMQERLAMELVEPSPDNGTIRVGALGNTTVRVHITDTVTGEPVDGLAVGFGVHMIYDLDGDPVDAIDYATLPEMTAEGSGDYSIEWHFEVPGRHAASIIASDPDEVYAPLFVDQDFQVEDGAAEADDKGFLGIPGPSTAFLLVGLAGAAMAATRRRQP